MLGKLIKYDIFADWKKYCALFAAALLTSLLTLIVEKMSSQINNNMFLKMMSSLIGTSCLVLISAVCLMTVVFAVIRFYKNLVRDEGYLMHTLPVPTWQLIASKLITAYIWFAASAVVICASVGIAMGEPLWLFDAFKGYDEFIESVSGHMAASTFKNFIASSGIMLLLSPAFIMTHIYLSFALGNLFNTHKLLMSVVMYFVINVAQQILSTAFMAVFMSSMISGNTYSIPDEAIFGYVGGFMNFSVIFTLTLSAAYFIAAERIFSKKLNLE